MLKQEFWGRQARHCRNNVVVNACFVIEPGHDVGDLTLEITAGKFNDDGGGSVVF